MKDRSNYLWALIFLAVFVIGAGVDTVYDPRQLRRTSDGPLNAGFHPIAASGNTVSNSAIYETAARMFVFDKTFCVSNALIDSWMTITNTASGSPGWHFNKRIPGSNYPICLVFSVGYTNKWEVGMDYQDYDFVLAYNHAKNADFIRMTTNNTLKICADAEPSPGTNKSHLIVGSTNVDYELLRLQIAAQQSDALSIHKFNDVERGWVRFAQGADRTADWRVGMGDGINRYGLSFFNGGGAYCNRLNAGREVMRLDGLDTNLVWANDPGGSYGTVTIGTATNAGALWVNTPSVNTEYPSGLGVDGTYDSLLSTINLKAFGVKSAGGYGSDMAFWTTTDDSSNRVVTFHKNGDVGIKKTLLITNDVDWIGGNVTYVPIGGDINTYITNAVDGDTLILASGDYTITDSIYVNKRLNIMGQGCGGFSETASPYTRGTTIKSSAANIKAFVVATNNVRLANFSTLINAVNARSINTLTNLIGIVVESVFMLHSGNSMQVGIWINGSEVVFRNSSFYIFSGNDNAYGLYHINDANCTLNTEVDCYNVYGSVVGGTVSANGCFGVFNYASSMAHSMNLYHCYGKTIDSGSVNDFCGVVYSTGAGSATMNAYHSTFNGQDQDVYNTDGAMNLYDCVLFNNLKSGTVNWQRAFYTTNLTVYGASTFAGPVTNTASAGYANYQSSATGTNYFAGPVGVGTIPTLQGLTVNGAPTVNSIMRVGSIEFQPYSINNTWFGENAYYDGQWKYRSNGNAVLFYLAAGGFQVRTSPNGLAGAVAPFSQRFIVQLNGDVGIGGTQVANSITNATMAVLASGNVGIGVSGPFAKLDVNGGVNIGSTAFDPGANNLFVQGNAGFGTNSPQARIHVGAIGCTTFAEGIQFGNDTYAYRSGVSTLSIGNYANVASAIITPMFYANSGTVFASGGASTPASIWKASSSTPIIIVSNATASALVDLQQWATIASSGPVAVVNSNGYFGLGLTTTTNRLAINGMTYHTNVTASGGDPVNGALQWSASGEWQYRTAGASEGAGQINRVHNRSAQVVGVGTDYTLTQTMTNVVFGTSGGAITLPSAGTYVLNALANHVGGNANDVTHWRLYDTNSLAEVPGSYQVHTIHANGDVDITPSHAIYTSTGSVVIALQAMNVTAARGTVTSTNTTISYMRCY